MKVTVTKKRVGIEATILNYLEGYLMVNEEVLPQDEILQLKAAIEYQKQRTPTDQCPL